MLLFFPEIKTKHASLDWVLKVLIQISWKMPKLTKADISGPTNFQHISGIDTKTGGSFNLNDDLTPITEQNECDKTSKNMVRII